ncbi:MAG TPA: ABC transporter permease [candidate division Zixibacteria bacterium]|nr:ABC transporter permease [candidate division Zixibacteria bacterium]
MRNTWLIMKREYLARVRTRGFILFTVLMPAFMAAVVLLPGKLMMRSTGPKHIVIVSSNAAVADVLKHELETAPAKLQEKDEEEPGGRNQELDRIEATIEPNVTESTDKDLAAQVESGKVDGYLWLSDKAIESRKVAFTAKNSGDFMLAAVIRSALRAAFTQSELAKKGIGPGEASRILAPVSVESVTLKQGKKSKGNEFTAIVLPFLLMMMIYVVLIVYGTAVMRAVLEEKTTRVVEVLLSSVSPTQLLTGKLLGVGAAGFTQILIWSASGAILGTPYGMALRSTLHVEVPFGALALFPVFFVFGFLIYSTMYAALGAMVNSDEEAQQLQWPVLMPIIFCTVFSMAVVRDPNSQLAFWLSIFPLTSPLIMFVRTCVEMPPWWQLALCFVLLIAAIWGLLEVCGRIYRIGILMYGKRPTLPEILKWIKYA